MEPAQRPANQPEVGRSVVLVEHLGEPGVVEIVLAETGGEPERLRGNRLVLEPAGVRDEARIEAERRFARQLPADLVDQPRHELARRGRVGVHQPDRAAAVVRPMVVDPDQLLGCRRRGLEHPQPIERRTVARHHHGRRPREPVGRHQELEPGKHVGPSRQVRWVVGERTRDLGVAGNEMLREPEHRSEGVGVGVHVARHRNAVGFAQDLGGPGEVLRRHAKHPPRDAAGR